MKWADRLAPIHQRGPRPKAPTQKTLMPTQEKGQPKVEPDPTQVNRPREELSPLAQREPARKGRRRKTPTQTQD